MRSALSLVLCLTLLGTATPAAAEICAIDVVPAATLLLPYFAVDLSKLRKPKRTETTTLIVQNTQPSPTVARVTFWTDLSVPTLALDLYLTGYDVHEIPLYEVFRGKLPNTSEFLDPGCAPWGLVDETDLQNAHRGRPVGAYSDRCAGRLLDGKTATGYVTIDNINVDEQCSSLFPSDTGYFQSGGSGVASNLNGLIGWVNNDNRKVQYGEIEPLVHIEAGSGTGGSTFYGRYVGFNGADGREPLGTTWSFLFNVAGGARTYLEVWRDSGAVQGPFDCESLGEQGWFPLGQTQVVAFDQQEDAVEICESFEAADPVSCFPAEAGSYRFDNGNLAVPYGKGWTYLNLNTGDGIRQSYVSVRQTLGSGKRRGRSPAASFSSACDDSLARRRSEPVP